MIHEHAQRHVTFDLGFEHLTHFSYTDPKYHFHFTQSISSRGHYQIQLYVDQLILLALCTLDNLSYFCYRLLTFFSKSSLKKQLIQEHYKSVKRFGFQIKTDVLSVLTWVQTVCKGYQQMAKVAASKDKVNSIETPEPLTVHMKLVICPIIPK